ncbi:hypothetical protein BCR34DRAFT_592228 [Clohesyomyces aquaticus]|uniref:Uncharacterized protein n=1 Tax=Clohesyomyces aquaticus TaxID=1231657 RepID=A0A1Y1YU53_9PLEO|nr:hypothetical protein BCR34DRAFT_592228 [Clohesyomyces aquaticus]
MCIILPVDHVPCTHTVAIWQHCVNAPRSRTQSFELCSHIRQHPRPIVTRKLCFHCGGPRFFARRGGIADRGRGSTASADLRKMDYLGDPEDSGYASDAIIEEEEEEQEEQEEDTEYEEEVDEEDDSDLSPRHTLPPRSFSFSQKTLQLTRKSKSKSDPSPKTTQKPTPEHEPDSEAPSATRKPSWRPNLKLELAKLQTQTSPFPRRESNDSHFEDGIGRARRSAWGMTMPSDTSSTSTSCWVTPQALPIRRNAKAGIGLYTGFAIKTEGMYLRDFTSEFSDDSDEDVAGREEEKGREVAWL